MINLKLLVRIVFPILLVIIFTFNVGTAQELRTSQDHGDEFYNNALDALSKIVASAIKDTSIKIALCRNTGDYIYSKTEAGIPLNSFSIERYQ